MDLLHSNYTSTQNEQGHAEINPLKGDYQG